VRGARDNLDSKDSSDDPIDDEAKRRPPPSISDELGAVLPKILEAMPPEANHEEPRRSGDARRGNHHKDRRHAAFDDDPALAPVGNGEPDVDGRDQHKTEGVDRRPDRATERQVVTPLGVRRRRLPRGRVHVAAVSERW